MKKLPVIAGILMLIFVSSCRDIVNSVLDAVPPFDVPFNTTLDVPFASVSTTGYTKTPDLPMNIDLDAKIKENNPNFSINNLKSVKLNSLTLNYVSSQLGNKLDVIKNARIYVKAPNQTDRLIATAYNNTNPNSITFSIPDEEILEYFHTTQNYLVLEIQANNVTVDQIKMNVVSGFKIKVQL